jgi:hypothetical protein
MARLVRCDRCHAEKEIGSSMYGTVELPILTRDEVVENNASKELCFSCLKELWVWLNPLKMDYLKAR